MKKPSRILVPVDFSEPSLEALALGICMASLMDSHLILLAVLPSPSPEIYDKLSVDKEAARKSLETKFEERIRHVDPLSQLEESRPKFIVRDGSPVDEILGAAKDERADLIVMGTHGRTGLAHAVMGSVTEQIVRRAECPVMTWRGVTQPAEKEPAVKLA